MAALSLRQWDSNLVRTENCKYKPAYEPSGSTSRYIISIFTAMQNDLIKGIVDAAKRRFRETPMPFCVNPERTVEDIKERYITNIRGEAKEIGERMKTLLLNTGLDAGREKVCRNLAFAYLEAFAKQLGKPVFIREPLPISIQFIGAQEDPVVGTEIDGWGLEKSAEAFDFCYLKAGLKIAEERVAFTKEDFEHFGVDPKRVGVDAANINCMSYALLRTGETRAKDYIFQPLESDRPMKTIVRMLQKWDYRITGETPQKNDLFVYLDANDLPVHLGYFDGEKVVSKPGFLSKKSYRHEVFELSPTNGIRAVIFRKNS